MGTNFYWTSPDKQTALHIGKRSAAGGGLCSFTLQGHEEEVDSPLTTWRQWKMLLRLPKSRIWDEYEQVRDAEDFIAEVEETTPENRGRHWDWVRVHGSPLDGCVPRGEGPERGDQRTWLDPEGFSFLFAPFS